MNNNYNQRQDGDTLVAERTEHEHRDPITGTPGSHPLGTALGAAPVALAGTIVGAAVGGPVGLVLGAVAGAVAGGAVGHEAAESANPTILSDDHPLPAMTGLRTELELEHAAREESLGTERPFAEHLDAYSLGVNERLAAQDEQRAPLSDVQEVGQGPLDWNDQVEARLRQGWETTRSDVGQAWTDVKGAVKSALDATGRRLDEIDKSDDTR